MSRALVLSLIFLTGSVAIDATAEPVGVTLLFEWPESTTRMDGDPFEAKGYELAYRCDDGPVSTVVTGPKVLSHSLTGSMVPAACEYSVRVFDQENLYSDPGTPVFVQFEEPKARPSAVNVQIAIELTPYQRCEAEVTCELAAPP